MSERCSSRHFLLYQSLFMAQKPRFLSADLNMNSMFSGRERSSILGTAGTLCSRRCPRRFCVTEWIIFCWNWIRACSTSGLAGGGRSRWVCRAWGCSGHRGLLWTRSISDGCLSSVCGRFCQAGFRDGFFNAKLGAIPEKFASACGGLCGGAMMLNTIIAVSLGGTLPLVMRRFNLDPALASGPILTTVTDMCGFFLVLSFASMFLSRLT